MDSYREYPSEFEPSPASEVPAGDVSAAIGTDERRMHVRAYNYWVSLLDGRDFPSIEDLEPTDVADFSGHSVLLDFTCGRKNPAIPYIGAEIRDECGLDEDTRNIADVPSRSLLSRLTDHYMQIIANRAPIGFEAEFLNQRSENICYRGILMPFSSDGDAIDFIYGVINWKTVARGGQADASFVSEVPIQNEGSDVLLLEEEVAPVSNDAGEPNAEQPFVHEQAAAEIFADEQEAGQPFVDEHPADEAFGEEQSVETAVDMPIEGTFDEEHGAWADGPSAELDTNPAAEHGPAPVHFAWEEGPLVEAADDEIPELVLDENAGLADRLWAARETAESVKAGEGRTRVSLYRALSLAYDVALVAEQNPQDYEELLEESGVKAQARAPMTPIVKLVFGVDYDKARLTEFAAALSYARRQDVGLGEFKGLIEKQSGGLKALVAAERAARRPEAKADTKGDAARAKLRSAPVISLADVSAQEEFAVVVTRRNADGSHEPVAIVDDESLVERAIRKVA
jgi:hypothetical protein